MANSSALRSAAGHRAPAIIAILAVGLLAVVGLRLVRGDGYQLQLVFPSAPDVVKGLQVQVDGFDAGEVTDLEAKDGQAIVTVTLQEPYDEMPEGSTAEIEWKAVLGERVIQIVPGDSDARNLPDNAMVRGDDRVEIDQVLAALDDKTRERLASTIIALDSAVENRGNDLNATLEQLGPALEALGTVLGGIGADGPAIRDVVTRSAQLMDVLDQNSEAIRSTIHDLDAQQSDLAVNDQALAAALQELPATLEDAQAALGKVPGTVDAAHPLLTELTTSVEALPAFTDQVSPLLRDLNPTLRSTRSTLHHLSDLLGITPELLVSSTRLLPEVDTATGRLLPALSFLRPYTPEITGYFTNWASAGQQYLGRYHVGRIKAQGGTTTPIGVLNALPPGVTQDETPLPGSIVGQPWADATGARIR
jgi:phospholipid/cholesterol/gamma-HCH transport system substrate-binding protein